MQTQVDDFSDPRSGLDEILGEISPIEDFSGSMSLSFSNPRFEDVKASEEECKDKDMTFRLRCSRHVVPTSARTSSSRNGQREGRTRAR